MTFLHLDSGRRGNQTMHDATHDLIQLKKFLHAHDFITEVVWGG
jgi:hypothetical protein